MTPRPAYYADVHTGSLADPANSRHQPSQGYLPPAPQDRAEAREAVIEAHLSKPGTYALAGLFIASLWVGISSAWEIVNDFQAARIEAAYQEE